MLFPEVLEVVTLSLLRIYSVTKNSSILAQSKAKQAQTAMRTATIPPPTTPMRYTRVSVPWNLLLVFGQNLLVFKLPHKVNRTLKIKGDWNHKAFVITENQNFGGRLLLGQCFGGWIFQHESHLKPTISAPPPKGTPSFQVTSRTQMESFGSQLCQVPVQTNQKRGYSSLSGSPQGNGGTLWFPVPNTLGWVNDAQSGHLLGGRDTVASVSLQSWYHRNLARALGRLTGTSLGVQQLDPTLPQQGEGIRSLVGELISHWPHGVAKKKKKKKGWVG